ncbi:MAG TPA: shikimate dehydrogenase [Kiritimatiellia bacterium]|nr:shikimate dehydrogenase [Kiritimatiellia bacterium]
MKKSAPIPFALLGHPVGHSLSPAMHNAAFKALGIHARYSLLDVLPGDIPRTLEDLQQKNFGGVNITIPHKEEAFRFLKAHHEVSPHARALQSVNTVVFRPDGKLYGDNTDAPGFLDALREAFRATPRGKRILLLGCGGAGRALALTCARQGATAMFVSDINMKARCRLRRDLKKVAPQMEVGGVALSRAEQVAPHCDVIIQATPVGMKPGDPPLLPATAFRKGQMVFDLIYRPALTPTLAAAQEAGARTQNGLGMLLHQGARAFQLWTGRKPPVAVMRAALEKALKARRN